MTVKERNARRRIAYHLDRARLECAGRPMMWGCDDCALFHADIEAAALKRDPAASFRGRYTTRRGAHRVLGRGGLPGALRKAARRYGWRRVKPRDAHIGDLGIVTVGQAFACVRLLHRNEWIGRNDSGWSMVPTERVRLAWSVI